MFAAAAAAAKVRSTLPVFLPLHCRRFLCGCFQRVRWPGYVLR